MFRAVMSLPTAVQAKFLRERGPLARSVPSLSLVLAAPTALRKLMANVQCLNRFAVHQLNGHLGFLSVLFA